MQTDKGRRLKIIPKLDGRIKMSAEMQINLHYKTACHGGTLSLGLPQQSCDSVAAIFFMALRCICALFYLRNSGDASLPFRPSNVPSLELPRYKGLSLRQARLWDQQR